MTNKLVVIQRGESLPFKFDRGGASIEQWTCVIKVKQKPDDLPDIARTIPSDDDRAFSGFLTRTETLNLIEGLWYLTGVLTNVSTDEQEEIPVRFQVSKTWSIPNMVSQVIATPAGSAGPFTTMVSVNLMTGTPGATIHFTIDGSEPSTSSPIFTSDIIFVNAGSPHTLKAFAVRDGFVDSDVLTEIYVVNP